MCCIGSRDAGLAFPNSTHSIRFGKCDSCYLSPASVQGAFCSPALPLGLEVWRHGCPASGANYRGLTHIMEGDSIMLTKSQILNQLHSLRHTGFDVKLSQQASSD